MGDRNPVFLKISLFPKAMDDEEKMRFCLAYIL